MSEQLDNPNVHDNSELKKILILLTTPTKEHLKEIIYYILKKFL